MSTKLTDAKLRGLKPPVSGQIEVSDPDVPGLRVRIGSTGVKTFILRKRVAGKIRNIKLDRYGPRFGLADARKAARGLLNDIEAGKALAPSKSKGAIAEMTVSALIPKYLAAKSHLRSVGEIKRILERYVMPELGDRLADAVTRRDVTELIDSIATDAPTMARAVHAQLSSFYTWALPALDRLPANPCLGARRPGKPKPRDRVLSDDELAALWEVADTEPAPWGPAVKLLMLTGARRDEVFSANRAEFDLVAKEWTIPAERAKNGLPHIVPLSPAALALLKSIEEVEDGAKLFPNQNKERQDESGPGGISKAVNRIRARLDAKLDRADGARWTLHDIRRTVATGLQRLGVRFEVTEAVLNHISGSKGGVAGVYQRHHWKAEKRGALEAWAVDLMRIVEGEPANRCNVVRLERGQ